MDDRPQNRITLISRLLCWAGMHDFRVVDATFSFGQSGAVETVECQRCGYRTTRQGSQL